MTYPSQPDLSTNQTLEILLGSRGIFHREPERLVMLWSYTDDSSDDKRERFCAAGGLFTTDKNWQKFEAAWVDVTRGLSQPFRSTDCECGYGQFVDWSKSDRDVLFRKICELIVDFDLGAFGSCVSVPEYRRVFPLAEEHGPYLLCLGTCFANLAEICAGSNEMISHFLPPMGVRYWVEENQDTAGKATQIYHDLKAVPGWKPGLLMSGISHLGKQIVGLQAADLIAREVYKYYDNRGIRPLRKPVITLCNNVTFFEWSTGALEEFSSISNQHGPAKAHTFVARSLSLQRADSPITQERYSKGL